MTTKSAADKRLSSEQNCERAIAGSTPRRMQAKLSLANLHTHTHSQTYSIILLAPFIVTVAMHLARLKYILPPIRTLHITIELVHGDHLKKINIRSRRPSRKNY